MTGLATALTAGNIAMHNGQAIAADGSGISWDSIAACESGGNWHTATGNGYLGGLQWTVPTWTANGGTGNPANATREQQITVAERIIATQGVARGLANWPVCGKKAFTAAPSAPRHAAPPVPSIPLPVTPAPRHAAPDLPPPPAGPTVDYTTTAGDTLSAIADTHQVPGGWAALAALNGMPDPDTLAVDQVLKLPAPPPAPVPVVPAFTAGVINGVNGVASGVTGKPVQAPLPPVQAVAVAPSAFTQPTRPAPAVAAPSIAAKAVTAALGQIGTPYVYGGNTPGKALDCSALIAYAYRQAGIQLPRVAAAQSTMGHSVPLAQVRPGDLLFYAYGQGISHVAMVIGDGKIVEASQPGHPVAVRPMYLSGFAGARRLT